MNARDRFAFDYDVPRGTLAKLDAYIDCLADAQTRMNLVGSRTLPDVWTRHIADSAQLRSMGDANAPWLDLGAGAGFPGIVLALLGANIDLVESTAKKARFLGETIDKLGIASHARVHCARIEMLTPWPVATIVTRALAPLTALFDYGMPFTSGHSRWVLPKGAQVEGEITAAHERFTFDYELVQSRTAAEGRIIVAHSVALKDVNAARDR